MNSRNMLDKEIENLLENLRNCNPESEQYKAITDRLDTLYRLRIEEDKNTVSCEIEEIKTNNEKFLGYLKVGSEIGLGVLSFVGAMWFATRGFKFEETGTFTSTIFRNGMGKFRFK